MSKSCWQHGIDVYTTVNIQHIESLNDVVAQITRVRVRETVPDSIFDRADAVELVDLTPEDLIQRLKEGKVYVPRQAERALEHFFSPANLTALRELALRRTAERVDEQLLTRNAGTRDPGALGGGRARPRLRQRGSAGRRAGALRQASGGPAAWRLWTALYVETRRSLQLSEEQRDRIADTLRLAQALGGEAVTIPGGDRRIADDVIAYARANNVTQIIIGKSSRSRWFEILHGSVVHDLVRRAGNISVHVVAGEDIAKEAIPKESGACGRHTSARSMPRPYAFSRCDDRRGGRHRRCSLWPWIGLENIDLVFLTGIVGIAVRFGLWPSLLRQRRLGAVLQFLLHRALLHLHHFQIRPMSSRSSSSPSWRSSSPTSRRRARVHAVAAMDRARTTEALYAFSRKLAGVGTLDDVLWATAYQTALMLKVRVVLLLPRGRHGRGEGRISAGGHPRRGRSRGGEMGLAEQSSGRARLGYAARRQAAVPADAHRARRRRRRRHRQRQARAAADARPAPAARRPNRPGRAGDRAR